MLSHFFEHRLSNGLRIVGEQMPRASSSAIGFLVRAGSRHESPELHGVSHFLEHMCFKGNARLNAEEISVRFDELGSIYNAYTGKEHTIYFGWAPSQRVAPQLELLADLVHPTLPADEFETERKVVLEEIAMSDDSFDHHVWNILHRTLFGDHPLAHEILGERESVEQLSRETMAAYHAARYAPENMTLVVAGGVDQDEFIRAAERHCADWAGDGPAPSPQPAKIEIAPGEQTDVLEQFQQQSVLGCFVGEPANSPEAETLESLQSILGGANSRCYWDIVQRGAASAAGASWLSYQDCGLFVLWADGKPTEREPMANALRLQAERLMRDGVSEEEVRRVKNRRRTQLAFEAENPRTRLMQIIDDIETYDRPRSAEERLAAVEAVDRTRIENYLAAHPLNAGGLWMSIGPQA